MKANICIDTLVKASKGRFVTVTFKTKSGRTRVLNGRIGVGGAPARQDSKATGGKYLLLWEVKTRGYRKVNLRTVSRIAMEKTELFVNK